MCSSCACGGWAVPLLLRAPTEVLVVAVQKQSPSSLPCQRPVPQQPRGCEGRGEQSHVLCLKGLIERSCAFCVSDRLKYESKKSKSTGVAVSNDFGFSSVLSGNFQDICEHCFSTAGPPTAPAFPSFCPAASRVAMEGGNWLIPPCCPPSIGEELVGLGDGCSCPPHVEMLLDPAYIHPCPPCLGWCRGLCLEA